MKAIYIDVETSSLYGEVIELAWAYIDSDFRAQRPVVERFQPSGPLQPGAVAIHRITASQLSASTPAKFAASKIPKIEYWIGHNIVYDWTRLGRPRGVRLLCTMQLSKLCWPEAQSFKLSALYLQLFGVSDETVGHLDGLHEASTDIRICARVFRRIMSEFKVPDLSALPYQCHPEDWR